MTKKIKTLIYFLDNYEWINIVSVLIMTIVSLYLFISHTASSVELMIIIGLIAILKGFLNFNIFLCLDSADRNNKKGPISFVYTAMVNIGIGVLLILNIITNPVILLVLSAIWMFLDTIPYVLYAIKHYVQFQNTKNYFIATFSIILLTIVAHLATSAVHWFGPEKTTALFLMLSSLNLWLLIREKKQST